MRRRFRHDILVTTAPPVPPAFRKKFKYENGLTPFNIWFREQLKRCGGLKTFCRETGISYNTAKYWTYKTNPQTNSLWEIAKYFGKKFDRPHLEFVAKIEDLKRKRETV